MSRTGVRADTALELYSVLRVSVCRATALHKAVHCALSRVSRAVSARCRGAVCARVMVGRGGVRSWGCYGSREWRLAWLSAASRTAVTCCCSLR